VSPKTGQPRRREHGRQSYGRSSGRLLPSRKLDAAKAHLAETVAALRKSLEALEAERKARSDAEREVVVLRGQMLGAEESNTRLLERVTGQEEGLSILESACLGTYLFCPRLMP